MIPRLQFKSWTLALLLATSAAFAQISSDECNRKLITQNRFEVRRGFDQYRTTFPDLYTDLEKLGPGQHWLDSGGGEGVAIREYFFKNKKPLALLPQGTLLTYKLDYPVTFFHRNVQVMQGRFFEDIPASELPHADVITDLFGVFSYTTQKDRVLARYLDLLKPGGVIYLYTGASKGFTAYAYHRRFKRMLLPQGRQSAALAPVTFTQTLNLPQWLSQIQGIRVQKWGKDTAPCFRITRTDGPYAIPVLDLMSSSDSLPPVQVYQSL